MIDPTHPQTQAREVVELRIQGVGGSSARQILNASSQAPGEEVEAEQVDGDEWAGFYRPRAGGPGDRILEAYEWGRLTSGSATSALWWLLLPFSLINVAGWMFRESPAPRRRDHQGDPPTGWRAGYLDRERLSERPVVSSLSWGRGLVFIGGLMLTMLYTLWALVLVLEMHAIDCGANQTCAGRGPLWVLRYFEGHPIWRLAVGLATTMTLAVLLLWFVQRSQRLEQFERDPARRVMGQGWFNRTTRNTRIEDPGFWHQWREYRRAWRWHLGAVLGTIAAVGGYSFTALRHSVEGRSLALDESGWSAAWGWSIAVLAVVVVSGTLLLLSQERLSDRIGAPNRGLRSVAIWTFWLLLVVPVCFGAGSWWGNRVHAAENPVADQVEVLATDLHVDDPAVRAEIDRLIGAGWPPDRAMEHAVQKVAAADPAIDGPLGLMNGLEAFVWALTALGALLLLVLAWRRIRFKRAPFRSFAPFALAALAPLVAGAGFGGLTHLFNYALFGWDRRRIAGYETMLTDLLAVGLLSFAVVFVIARLTSKYPAQKVVGDYFTNPGPADEDPVPPQDKRKKTKRRSSGNQEDQHRVLLEALDPRTRGWVKAVAAKRQSAAAGNNADWKISTMVGAVLVALAAQVVVNGGGFSALITPCNWPGITFAPPLWGVGPATFLHTTAAVLIVLLLFPGVYVMRIAFRERSTRRQFGKVWDVAGFWPRRFHPFAAPSYAERAVPEFRDRIKHHLSQGRRVVISAHSQGTAIAFAALAQIIGEKRQQSAHVADRASRQSKDLAKRAKEPDRRAEQAQRRAGRARRRAEKMQAKGRGRWTRRRAQKAKEKERAQQDRHRAEKDRRDLRKRQEDQWDRLAHEAQPSSREPARPSTAGPEPVSAAIPAVGEGMALLEQARRIEEHGVAAALRYETLVEIGDHDPLDIENRVALVTHGSPLASLYCLAFPRQFTLDRLRQLQDALGGRWQSFYRPTDYIGTTVFSDPRQPPPADESIIVFRPGDEPTESEFGADNVILEADRVLLPPRLHLGYEAETPILERIRLWVEDPGVGNPDDPTGPRAWPALPRSNGSPGAPLRMGRIDSPRFVMAFLHGTSTYAALYETGLRRLAGNDGLVLAFDLPEHGARRAEKLTQRSLERLAEEIVAELGHYPAAGVVVAAESLGCACLTPLLAELRAAGRPPAAAVLFAPPLVLNPISLARWAARTLRHHPCKALRGRVPVAIPAEDLIHDPAMRDKLSQDPLAHGELTIGYLWRVALRVARTAAMLRRLRRSRQQRRPRRLRTPTLAVQGTEDLLLARCSLTVTRWVLAAPRKDCRTIPGGRHSLFWDEATDHMLTDAHRWLKDTIGSSRPPGPAA